MFTVNGDTLAKVMCLFYFHIKLRAPVKVQGQSYRSVYFEFLILDPKAQGSSMFLTVFLLLLVVVILFSITTLFLFHNLHAK